MLGTNDPNNQKLQKSLKELAGLAKLELSTVVSYDPANPATFNAAIDTAITKKADYIAEAGIPLTPAMIKKVQDAGAKWVLTSVHPVEVKDPIIVNANAYANDELMGKVLANFFITDSKGKGNVVIEHVPAYPILRGFTDGFQAEVKAQLPGLQGEDPGHHDPGPGRRQGAERDGVGAALEPGRRLRGLRRRPVRGRHRLRARGRRPDGQGQDHRSGRRRGGHRGLKSGKHTAWTGFDPVYSTYVMMDAMFRDSLGMPIDAEASGLQTTQILTTDNVGGITGNWGEPKDALDQFKKLWGMS